jgi:hypothetical protein
MNKHTAFLLQIFFLFETGAVPPPPPPTQWGEGGLIGPSRDIRYFSIYNLHNKLMSLGVQSDLLFWIVGVLPRISCIKQHF